MFFIPISNKHFKTNITTIYSDALFVVDFFFWFFWDQNNVLLFCETNKNNYFFVKKIISKNIWENMD